jgi:hypothetical protein
LFFDCDLAKLIWRLVQVSFNLSLSTNIHHLFNDRLGRVNTKLNGSDSSRSNLDIPNDIVFDKVIVPSYLQVVFRGTH